MDNKKLRSPPSDMSTTLPDESCSWKSSSWQQIPPQLIQTSTGMLNASKLLFYYDLHQGVAIASRPLNGPASQLLAAQEKDVVGLRGDETEREDGPVSE